MNNKTITNNEIKLSENDLLISRTDRQGDITFANADFIRVCGYLYEDLLGAHHNIVRHPDMPKEAFKNLWDTIKEGRSWNGLVKNRTKSGDFYWVRANVTPYIQNGKLLGYASVRVKPSQDEIDLAEKVYQQISRGEKIDYDLVDGQLIPKGYNRFLKIPFAATVDGAITRMLMTSAGALTLSAVLAYAGMDAEHSGFMIAQVITAIIGFGMMGFSAKRASSSIKKSINVASDYAAQIAAGNIMADKPEITDSQISKILEMIDSSKKSLMSVSSQTRHSLNNLIKTGRIISEGNHDLSMRTDSQASALQQTAASMEELTATVLQNSSNATHASNLAEEATLSVKKTADVMADLVNRMTAIINASKEMGDKINVIENIALQTNILALNASVEAARAGEQGRGFAVVAQEVRNLAQRSGAASSEIRELIMNSSKAISEGEKLVKIAEVSIDGVISSVNKVDDIMAEISAASNEQSLGIGQVNQAVAEMDNVTHKNNNLVHSISNTTNELLLISHELEKSISIFSKGNEVAKLEKPDELHPASNKVFKDIENKSKSEEALKRPDLNAKPSSDDEWTEF